MRKWGRIAVLAVCVLLVGMQVIPVVTTNPAVDPGRTIEANVPIPPEVTGILGRACQDCHSNRTEWPWYSRVAPVSWFLVHHVNEGRGELNFSEWGAYAARRKDRKLKEICEQVTQGEMPPFSYTIAHRQAKLSDQDKQKVCQWAETTRQSQGRVLAAAAPPRG
jgi:hypothetical protein